MEPLTGTLSKPGLLLLIKQTFARSLSHTNTQAFKMCMSPLTYVAVKTMPLSSNCKAVVSGLRYHHFWTRMMDCYMKNTNTPCCGSHVCRFTLWHISCKVWHFLFNRMWIIFPLFTGCESFPFFPSISPRPLIGIKDYLFALSKQRPLPEKAELAPTAEYNGPLP